MEDMLLSAVRQFGFSAVMCLAMLFGFYRFMKWFMAETAKREVCYREIIDRQTAALNAHTEQAKDFHSEVKTAHEFQRTEHAALMERFKEVGEILTGIEKAVGRINGYTEHK